MLFYFIMINYILKINSFILKDSYNILLKDYTDYKIDEPINDQDYEMVNKKLLSQFNVDKETILYVLNKLAYKNYEKETIRPITILHSTDELVSADSVVLPPKRAKCSTKPTASRSKTAKSYEIIKTSYFKLTTHVHSKSDDIVDDDIVYNYNDILEEYINEEGDVTTNATYRVKIKGKTQNDGFYSVKLIFRFDSWTINCTKELKHIGFKAICCLLQDYRNGVTTRMLLARLWRIVKIWIGLYTFIAVPLWCTRGRCCCCLFCKFFKPRQTIDEAKRYFVANPPGVLRGANQEEVLYEPTDNERDAYEEFEHLIRTI